MDILSIEKPTKPKRYRTSYSYTQSDLELMNRKRQRANELGILLFSLDGDDSQSELKELEDYIIDNFIDLDIDVPDDLKKKYLALKKEQSGTVG